jgi:hypothetical protein
MRLSQTLTDLSTAGTGRVYIRTLGAAQMFQAIHEALKGDRNA